MIMSRESHMAAPAQSIGAIRFVCVASTSESRSSSSAASAKMPKICENTGSAARDFAMLERNLLSHIRLATLLLLLSASVLLNARLPSPSEPSGKTPHTSWSIPLASVQTGTAVVTILAGIWEYHRGYKDMQDMRGFLLATKYVYCQLYWQSAAHMPGRPHFWVMSAIAVVVFASCIMFIGNNKSL